MLRSKKPIAIVATALAGLLLLAGCSTSSSGAHTTKDTLTVATTVDLKSPNPIQDNGLFSIPVFHAIYDQLTFVDADGKLVPRLATEWTATPDALTWTFTMRTDAKFSNGDPVTPEDVVFTYNEVINTKGSPLQTYTNGIASVATSGANQVVFTLKAANSNFPRLAYSVSILPEKVYKALGADGFAAAPIGSGPYTFVSWSPGISTKLKANPNYWGTKANIENVTLVPIADPEARVNGLLSGELDVTAISPAQVATVDAANGYKSVKKDGNQTVFLAFNTLSGAFTDPNLRKAVSMAIDRDTIVSTVLDGYGLSATAGTAAPAVNGSDASLKPLTFDLAAAKALVANSSYDGSPVTLAYPTDGNIPGSTEIAQVIGQSLEKIGINVQMSGADFTTHNLLTSSKKQTGMYLSGMGPANMDSSTVLQYMYSASALAMFDDPQIDALAAEANATVDPDARRAVIAKVWGINADKTYLANIDYTVPAYGVADDLQWDPRSDGQIEWVTASWK